MQWKITEVKPFMMMLKAYFRLSQMRRKLMVTENGSKITERSRKIQPAIAMQGSRINIKTLN